MSTSSEYLCQVDFRRRLMMLPDVWPDGVTITSGEGFTRQVTGQVVYNVNRGMESSTWGIYLVPIKHATRAVIVTSRNEYIFFGNKDLTGFKAYTNDVSGQTIPSWAYYAIHSSRSGSATLTSVTFYYYTFPPENWVPDQYYSIILDDRHGGSNYLRNTRLAPCHGATTLTRTSGSRGNVYWFDENKNAISNTGAGTATSYSVPSNAYYFQLDRLQAGNSTTGSGFYSDREIISLSI